MIFLEPPSLSLHDYLQTLSGYELPGSTVNNKLLHLPFAHGQAAITYAEPGLAVMCSDVHLGDDVVVLKPKPHQAALASYDAMHYFCFTDVDAGDGICTLTYGSSREIITGSQALITCFRDDTPVLATYPPQCRISSVTVQVGNWWLEAHLPGLALHCRALTNTSGRHIYNAQPAAINHLQLHRGNLAHVLPYGELSSQALVNDFILCCYQAACGTFPEADNTGTDIIDTARRTDALIAAVLRNIHKPLPSVAQMSIEAGVNINTLRAVFRRRYGATPASYFAGHQMAWAEEELRHHRGTIKSIGYGIGYQNLSHFSEAFRKYRGRLPSEVIRALKYS